MADQVRVRWGWLRAMYIWAILGLLATLLLAGCTSKAGESPIVKGAKPIPDNDQRPLMQQVIEDVYNAKDLSPLDELIAPDMVYHMAGSPDMHGPEGFRQLAGMFLTAFPDLEITIEDMFEHGDRITGRWTMVGTHQGELMDIPPTGKRITMIGTSVDRVEGGQVAEAWTVFDSLGLMQQLGTAPAQGREYFGW